MNCSKPAWLYIDSVTLPLELAGKITAKESRITPCTFVYTEFKTGSGKRLIDNRPPHTRDFGRELGGRVRRV